MSLGAWSRPTETITGTPSAGRARGRDVPSMPVRMTTLRAASHVRASIPAARSLSETQIVVVVSSLTARSASR